MNSQERRFQDLVLEFEQKLDRRLETKERDFIKWMADQEESDTSKPHLHLAHC